MTPTPFQPVQFDEQPPQCCDGRPWNYEIFPDDEVVVQVHVGACSDAVEVITNTEITNSSDWDKFDADGNPAIIFNNRLNSSEYLQQPVTMNLGSWYEIKVTIVFPWTESPLFSQQVIRQNIISIEGFVETINIVAATGDYTFYGVWVANTDIIIRRTDTSFEAGTPNPTQIFQISIKEVIAPTIEALSQNNVVLDTVAISELNYPYVNINYLPSGVVQAAKCFKLRITQGCAVPVVLTSNIINIVQPSPCYVRLVGCGSNTFFQGNFAPPFRFRARLVDDGPVGTREIARNSIGVHRLTYGHVHMSYLLDVEEVPEHIRHFMYLLPYFEAVAMQIGENQSRMFFALEDAEKDEYPDGDDSLAGLSIRFVLKEQNLTSRYFGRCFPSFPPFVLGERSTNTAITDETDTILINA